MSGSAPDCGDAQVDIYLADENTVNKAYRISGEGFNPSDKDSVWLTDAFAQKRGIKVGSPGQTVETLYEDLQFIKELEPHMVGIGPFISQKDTPFANEKSGTMDETLRLLSIIRLIHPKVLLPATTALGTIHPLGREKGIQSGANVVMPNLSPVNVRDKYKLYDNKICTGDEAAECRFCMENRMKSIGYQVVVSRGDYADF